MTRARLPNRRASETIAFDHRGRPWTASVSRFADGRLAEIFLAAPKMSNDATTAAVDAAVVASIALQFGADVTTIRAALNRDAQGDAAGPLGAALDLIEVADG